MSATSPTGPRHVNSLPAAHVRHAIRPATRVLGLVSFLFLAGTACSQERGISGVELSAATPSKLSRVALVIGNAAYDNAPLKNPVNDAKDIAAALRKCGFQVTLETDCDLRAMKTALDAFGRQIPSGGVTLVFYAGHGIQVDGRNYLVPLGADPQGPGDVEFECLDAGRVLAKLEDGGAQLNIIILDACRNNPLSRSWTRGASQGLAGMETPAGSILLYATALNSVAQDGAGRNGLFTGQLLRHLSAPGLDVVEVFRRTGGEVQKASSGGQVPWLALNFTGQFSFVPGDGASSGAASTSVPPLPPPPEPMALVGGLQVSVNVSGATVKVDGKEAGTAGPTEALNIQDLPAGEVRIEVSAPDYEPSTKIAQIKEGEWTQVAIKLARVTASTGEERTFAGIPFVWIPAGTFTMGSPASEESRSDDEQQHQVTLTQGFWLGKYEVTQAQWQAVMGDNPSRFTGTSLPVETVSWDDCQAFIRKLNQMGEGTFRLPTESEWEYACRAGTTTPFHFGATISTDQANYDGNFTYGNVREGVYREMTVDVGSFPSNAWGLHDMHGNVWEWCQDWYGDYPSGRVTDPAGPATGHSRVVRGGSWNDDPALCRAADRLNHLPDGRLVNVGFRLLRTQD